MILTKDKVLYDLNQLVDKKYQEFSKKLCDRFKKAIVSTSANVSGMPTPMNFSEIPDIIKNAV